MKNEAIVDISPAAVRLREQQKIAEDPECWEWMTLCQCEYDFDGATFALEVGHYKDAILLCERVIEKSHNIGLRIAAMTVMGLAISGDAVAIKSCLRKVYDTPELPFSDD